MEFIVTPPECANADCYEIVEVETDLASAEAVKAELRLRFSQSWKTPVCVRSYPRSPATCGLRPAKWPPPARFS